MGAGGKQSFADALRRNQQAGKYICVGVDDMLAATITEVQDPVRWSSEVLERTIFLAWRLGQYAAAFKFSYAGWIKYSGLLHEIFQRINQCTSGRVPIILDAKWNDVEHTMEKYANQTFDVYGADAVTLSPYLGLETIKPFIKDKYADRGVFVLCKTSNPNSGEFQDRPLQDGYTKVWERVALQTQKLQAETGRSIGLVFGATHPQEILDVRVHNNSKLQLLIPGIGKQGGDFETSFINALLPDKTGPLINVSRSLWENLPIDLEEAAEIMIQRVQAYNKQVKLILDEPNRKTGVQ